MFEARIAGIDLLCHTRFQNEMTRLFSEYVISSHSADSSRLELDPGPWIDEITGETQQGPVAVEFYALSVALGELLPTAKRLQTHGVAIEYDGKAYIFTAPSGIGKSSRAFMWQKYLGADKVKIINGDKPILWFREDSILACGSPWAGKEGLHTNICSPVAGICLLKRSSENVIRPAGAKEYFDFFLSQVHLPRDTFSMESALSLIEELFKRVPVFILENDMSEQGTKVCFEALTGKEFNKCKI